MVPGSWEDQYARLERWVKEHGSATVPKSAMFEGARLGAWVQAMRQQYRVGALSKERVRRLEGLEGWVWATR